MNKVQEQKELWISADDGAKLFMRRWIPEQVPVAVVQIVHGMAEHSERYNRFATRLCTGAGIEVWAADLRGHGKTADPSINDAAHGGLLGHCADVNGNTRVTADIDCINRSIKKLHPDKPFFLMGHSWGSLLVQNYIEHYNYPLSGCILSGTRGPDGFRVRIGAPIMRAIAFLTGPRGKSKLARALMDGAFNKAFKPVRTAFDWISRDKDEVDRYVADTLCHNLCSAGFYRDLSVLISKIHRPECIEGIPLGLPLYIFSGSADPVGDMGISPTALVNVYRERGIKDLEFVLYPDARHETLNETNREEVTENLLNWILRHCETGK
ncbi:MAG: lysophospholipase [Spirochaetaceae bacterium]|jgi:alpha-beta hydrolase superfamily lysophospholipase|nr:lysophospholipase [Spirochaetaceae bacterium]